MLPDVDTCSILQPSPSFVWSFAWPFVDIQRSSWHPQHQVVSSSFLWVHSRLFLSVRQRRPFQHTNQLDQICLSYYLFSLSNQSLLQSLDLGDHFVCIGVSSFKFSPSVDIHGVLEFIGKTSDLELFFNELLLEIVDLILKLRNIISLKILGPGSLLSYLLSSNLQGSVLISNLGSKMLNIVEPFSVLGFSLSKSGLLDLDLLV